MTSTVPRRPPLRVHVCVCCLWFAWKGCPSQFGRCQSASSTGRRIILMRPPSPQMLSVHGFVTSSIGDRISFWCCVCPHDVAQAFEEPASSRGLAAVAPGEGEHGAPLDKVERLGEDSLAHSPGMEWP